MQEDQECELAPFLGLMCAQRFIVAACGKFAGVIDSLNAGNVGTSYSIPSVHENCIRCMSFLLCDSGKLFFCTADDGKCVRVWHNPPSSAVSSSMTSSASGSSLLKCIFKVDLKKRPSVVTLLDEDPVKLLVADKFGDVFCFECSQEQNANNVEQPDLTPVMGHVSTIVDMTFLGTEFLVTADRDEKIRVSHWPHPEKIFSYCLGHTDAVTCVVPLARANGIWSFASSSANGELFLWKLSDGTCSPSHRTAVLQQDATSAALIRHMAYCEALSVLAILVDRSCSIAFYRVSDESGFTLSCTHTVPSTANRVAFDSRNVLWISASNPQLSILVPSGESAEELRWISPTVDSPLLSELGAVVSCIEQETDKRIVDQAKSLLSMKELAKFGGTGTRAGDVDENAKKQKVRD